MTEQQRKAADAILNGAQTWAAEHHPMAWQHLMCLRTEEAVYIRAAVIELLREQGLSLMAIGELLDRKHPAVLNALQNIPAYRVESAYQRIEAGIREYIPTESITSQNQARIMFNATISGNLGRDAEARTIAGKEYTCFSVAAENGKNDTTWVRVNAYGSNRRDYLKKGAKVICIGRLSVGVYNGNADVTLWADNVEIVKFADDGKAEQPAPKQVVITPDGEDLPF